MRSAGSDASPTTTVPPAIARWVKTECGRAKYLNLASRTGPWARVRLWWFVGIAALRDWHIPEKQGDLK